MILYISGNLFQAPAQVLVNTVNTVGAMGKGVALTFKRLYPDMYKEYREICETEQLKIGSLYLYKSPNKWVLNFPTKKHWQNPSKVEYIESGLKKFTSIYSEMSIHSIAFPPLGCGHGQLDFKSQVQPIMEKYLRNLPIDVFIYPTFGTGKETPEHFQHQEMREWLRSEPSSLPFSEVWDDLTELLLEKKEFETFTKGNTFTVTLDADPAGIVVKSSRRNYQITKDALMAFWQQLRTHGFTNRNIKPGESKTIYYLVPIFSVLPYVQSIQLSDRYECFSQMPSTGLHVLPTAFTRRNTPEQLNFLDLN